jgi:CBS domain-containing protein
MSDPFAKIAKQCAGEVMTAPAVTVQPDDSVRAAAETMLRLRVGGLPVVDHAGRPLGLVSESDFRFADLAERRRLRETWVNILSGGQAMAGEYLDALEREADHVRQIMASPAICIDESESLSEAAEIMSRHRIRRVPVLRDGRVVGMLTRSDLLRFFAPAKHNARAFPTPAEFDQALSAAGVKPPKKPSPAAPAPIGAVSAAELKRLVAEHERVKAAMKEDAHRQAQDKRDEQVKKLLRERFSPAELTQLTHHAHEAARRGETSMPALVFPAALCADGGRAINAPDPDWPASLRGKAADFFLRWDKDLRPLGFALTARIVSFPEGFPGDVELTLVWGREG